MRCSCRCHLRALELVKPTRSGADSSNAGQATLSVPPHPLVTMMRGVYLAYVVILLAYFPVAIAGYAGVLLSLLLHLCCTSTCAWLLSVAEQPAAAGDEVQGDCSSPCTRSCWLQSCFTAEVGLSCAANCGCRRAADSDEAGALQADSTDAASVGRQAETTRFSRLRSSPAAGKTVDADVLLSVARLPRLTKAADSTYAAHVSRQARSTLLRPSRYRLCLSLKSALAAQRSATLWMRTCCCQWRGQCG